nr:dermonecrotic toxin StSicTox-betaIB1i-like [Parasteatoda tepidariorum]
MHCLITELLLIFITLFETGLCDDRWPIFIIGHAANSIEDALSHLDNGANVLESDVQFFPNGSVKELLHGCDTYHDCDVPCDKHVEMPKYFKYLRDITNPSRKNSYYSKLILQMLDLKLSTSNDLRESGRDLARHLLKYLWSKGDRPQEVKVVLYFNSPDQKDATKGFIQEFKDRGQESSLKDVGYDGGSGDISAIGEFFKKLNLENIWMGDGILNCLKTFYPNTRLKQALKVRNTGGFIKKVYDWTVDKKSMIRNALDLEVDGFITNFPRKVVKVLKERKYKKKFRVATKSDSPFEKFEG